jgi:hypothetical protein
MMRLQVDVEKLGTRLMLLLAVVTLVSVCVVGGMKSAALDLYQQATIARHRASPASHVPPGSWVSAWLVAGVRSDDAAALDVRAALIDHRSDRLVEATAVVALAGILVALLTGRPAAALSRGRDEASIPLANTSSNGIV